MPKADGKHQRPHGHDAAFEEATRTQATLSTV
jgi:hypothetical protein